MYIRKSWVGVLAGTAMLAGCSVHVNKGDTGEGKDVSIHTPFGGVQVHKNKGGAVDVGLPTYPGAVLDPNDGGDNKSADVQVSFGKWQLKVQVANYTTPDPQAKVQDFYKKALGRYGEVLTCQGDETVGTPTRTSEGLTCKEKDHGKMVNVTKDVQLQLKAGSERKQHIVAFTNKVHSETHFSLISLTLPKEGTGAGEDNEE